MRSHRTSFSLAALALPALVLPAFLAPAPAAAAETWKSDPDHSAAHFEVTHMMVSKVRGDFDEIEAVIELDEQNPEKSTVEVKVPVASIDTRNDKRDAHLKSEDFFHAEAHPYLTFDSKKIEKVGENAYRVTGDLTIRGVTHTRTFDVTASPEVKNPFSGTPVRGFQVTGQIDRKDFGLKWNKALETGGVLVGDDVDVVVEIEASPAQAEQAQR